MKQFTSAPASLRCIGFVTAGALTLLTAAGWTQSSPAQNSPTSVVLETFRDRNRVLVVYAPAAEKMKPQEFRKLWASAGDALRERDTVLLEFTDLKAQPDAARRLDLREGQFALALIGKDGHVAFRTSNPVTPASVFAQIDAMPMRRDEMKKRGQQGIKP